MPLYGKKDIQTYTWATKPAANLVPIYSEIWITDVGIVPVKFFSDGTNWQTDKSIQLSILSKKCIFHSFLAANASTYSQVGTLITVASTGHLLLAALNDGEIYLDAATGALLPGWYTGFTYIDANSFTCISTISQTISGTLTSRANTSVAVTAYNTTLRGGLLGKYGHLENIVTLASASTGSKTYGGFGTSNLEMGANTAARAFTGLVNDGTETGQWYLLNTATGFAVANGGPYERALDTTTDLTLQQKLTIISNNTWIALYSSRMTLYRSV